MILRQTGAGINSAAGWATLFAMAPDDPSDFDHPEVRQWAMILHLSVFAGYLVPLAGLIAPIVIWQMKKTDLPGVDAHGKVVVNALISYVIYAIGAVILVLFVIGIPLLIALAVIAVVFPIVGAIKANQGELWPYPLTIKFIA